MRSYILDDRTASFFRVKIQFKWMLKEAAGTNASVIQWSRTGMWPIAHANVWGGGGGIGGACTETVEVQNPPKSRNKTFSTVCKTPEKHNS